MAETDLLFADEVARILRRSPSTLQFWRSHGGGPNWMKIGRRVMYHRSEVVAFIRDEPIPGGDR